MSDFKRLNDTTYSRNRKQCIYYVIFIVITLVSLYYLAKFTSTPLNDNNPDGTTKSNRIWRKYRNPIESLDGVGYEFEKEVPFVPDPRFEMFNELPACDLTKDKDPVPYYNNPVLILQSFQSCINPLLQKFKGDAKKLNLAWVEETSKCDKIPVWGNLQIQAFPNLHETKWAILPKCKDEVNNLVTLGIGHDTKAEEFLNRTLPNTKFYGADPIIDPNLQLYSAFGQFLPFAIGKKGGIGRFKVLPNQNQRTRVYSYQNVTTVDLVYLLSDILGLKRVDFAWIDIEGGEFEFLDFFHKGGPLDQNNISICQFNLEVHSKFHPPGAQIFHDFIFRVLEEGRYVFLKPMKTDVGVHRMFFINVEDKGCVRKFLQ